MVAISDAVYADTRIRNDRDRIPVYTNFIRRPDDPNRNLIRLCPSIRRYEAGATKRADTPAGRADVDTSWRRILPGLNFRCEAHFVRPVGISCGQGRLGHIPQREIWEIYRMQYARKFGSCCAGDVVLC